MQNFWNLALIINLCHLFQVLLQGSACPDPITTVHIQHHEGPIYVSPDRLSCDLATSGNRGTCDNNPYANNQPQLLHNTHPCHVCGTDCNCVTKQLNTVPINMVPQNLCTPGTCCPDYNNYGYGYNPEYHGSDGCSIASEGLIPLLKSYLGQNKCPKHGCQCVQNYSNY